MSLYYEDSVHWSSGAVPVDSGPTGSVAVGATGVGAGVAVPDAGALSCNGRNSSNQRCGKGTEALCEEHKELMGQHVFATNRRRYNNL